MSNVQMATFLIQAMQNLVWSVLQAFTVPCQPKPLVVQDITVKQQQHPVAFVQVDLSVLEVEMVIPCVLKASMLAMAVHLALHVMLVITVPSTALLNQSSVQVATSLIPLELQTVQSAVRVTTVHQILRHLATQDTTANQVQNLVLNV